MRVAASPPAITAADDRPRPYRKSGRGPASAIGPVLMRYEITASHNQPRECGCNREAAYKKSTPGFASRSSRRAAPVTATWDRPVRARRRARLPQRARLHCLAEPGTSAFPDGRDIHPASEPDFSLVKFKELVLRAGRYDRQPHRGLAPRRPATQREESTRSWRFHRSKHGTDSSGRPRPAEGTSTCRCSDVRWPPAIHRTWPTSR